MHSQQCIQQHRPPKKNDLVQNVNSAQAEEPYSSLLKNLCKIDTTFFLEAGVEFTSSMSLYFYLGEVS